MKALERPDQQRFSAKETDNGHSPVLNIAGEEMKQQHI